MDVNKREIRLGRESRGCPGPRIDEGGDSRAGRVIGNERWRGGVEIPMASSEAADLEEVGSGWLSWLR